MRIGGGGGEMRGYKARRGRGDAGGSEGRMGLCGGEV